MLHVVATGGLVLLLGGPVLSQPVPDPSTTFPGPGIPPNWNQGASNDGFSGANPFTYPGGARYTDAFGNTNATSTIFTDSFTVPQTTASGTAMEILILASQSNAGNIQLTVTTPDGTVRTLNPSTTTSQLVYRYQQTGAGSVTIQAATVVGGTPGNLLTISQFRVVQVVPELNAAFGALPVTLILGACLLSYDRKRVPHLALTR